jgi:hypothetical protein
MTRLCVGLKKNHCRVKNNDIDIKFSTNTLLSIVATDFQTSAIFLFF